MATFNKHCDSREILQRRVRRRRYSVEIILHVTHSAMYTVKIFAIPPTWQRRFTSARVIYGTPLLYFARRFIARSHAGSRDVTASRIALVTSAEQGPTYSPFHPVHPWHHSCAPGTCTVCRAAPRSPEIARFRVCARRPSPARCKPCAANQECADR